MRLATFVLLAVVFLSACKSKPEDEQPPVNILDKEKMIAVLVDIHLAESYGYMLRVDGHERTTITKAEYAKIMNTHGVEYPKFRESYDWYMNHPVVYDLMYEEVINLIKEEEQFAKEHIITNETNGASIEMDDETPIESINTDKLKINGLPAQIPDEHKNKGN